MKTKFLKIGLALCAIMAVSVGNAQQTSGDVTTTEQTGVSTELNGTVRVVDNKGTMKFLQVKNGLTLLTDQTPDATGITTTWQLGGTLTDDTYIDVSGNVFALDGIALETGPASTNAVDLEVANGGGAAGTGYTLLVRNEATGATNKLLVSDLVKGGVHNGTATAATDYTLSGDATVPNDVTKIFVYRNGAKLLNGTDYSITGTVGAITVTVLGTSGVAPEDYSLITGDRIEIQWIR